MNANESIMMANYLGLKINPYGYASNSIGFS